MSLHSIKKAPTKDKIFCFVIALLVIALIFVKTGFEPEKNPDEKRARAEVVSVDNSNVKQFGIVKTGEQKLRLEILNTKHEGEQVKAFNQLLGKMELDTFYDQGDHILVTLKLDNGEINHVNVIDHYRLHIEIALLVLFVLFLAIFAGYTGMKAVLSFIFTALLIWKVLLPGFLKGINPVPLSLGIVIVLTFVIIFLIGGFSKKGLVAFLGAASGIVLTCILSLVFGAVFQIHGAVKPFSETLLYSGYPHLDLGSIFLAGIFLASSGAVMDVAMDIASAQTEVFHKHPEISRGEMISSGFSVGRAVIGTMTTTLLLAYSGSYTALLLVFIAQKIPATNMFNITYVSSEILHTMVGSFGLVTVAPLTALFGGLLLPKKTINKED